MRSHPQHRGTLTSDTLLPDDIPTNLNTRLHILEVRINIICCWRPIKDGGNILQGLPPLPPLVPKDYLVALSTMVLRETGLLQYSSWYFALVLWKFMLGKGVTCNIHSQYVNISSLSPPSLTLFLHLPLHLTSTLLSPVSPLSQSNWNSVTR